jgi:DNA-binding transcriptional regulator LsrR (DeoR family)
VHDDPHLSLACRAAWLAYVGGYTQEQIAQRLGVSRVKAHRLVAAAMENGLVKVFVEGEPAECIALEDTLLRRFRLHTCTVVPDVLELEGRDAKTEFAALGVSGARFLYNYLQSDGAAAVGVGHGRTLAALVEHLPYMDLPEARFVSLIGSFTRKSAANPFDVISRLAERTGGECYFMPVPFVADSVADADVLRAQRNVQRVLSLAADCRLCIVGIGNVGPSSHLRQTGMITATEERELQALGATGEVMGQFVDAEGKPLDCELNRRTLGVRLEDLRGRQVLAVAGGKDKVGAIRAVLRSGVVTGLIVDEDTARRVAAADETASPSIHRAQRGRSHG